MSIIDKLVPNPCGEDGTCLVKPACKLVIFIPWSRREKCYIYAKYYKRHDLVLNIINWIAASIAWTILLSIGSTIVAVFVLGSIRFYEIINGFIL